MDNGICTLTEILHYQNFFKIVDIAIKVGTMVLDEDPEKEEK